MNAIWLCIFDERLEEIICIHAWNEACRALREPAGILLRMKAISMLSEENSICFDTIRMKEGRHPCHGQPYTKPLVSILRLFERRKEVPSAEAANPFLSCMRINSELKAFSSRRRILTV